MVFKEFYQLKQEKNEKVQIFSVRLREALNKLTLRFTDKVPAGDEDRILCDHFFYGMKAVPANSYSMLYPGSVRAKVALRNMTPKEIVLKAKTCVAKMAAANVVLHMSAPKIVGTFEDKAQAKPVVNDEGEVKLTPLSPEQQKKLNSKLDLMGIEEWSQEHKKAVDELFREYGRLFALEKHDLGHTIIVKHKI